MPDSSNFQDYDVHNSNRALIMMQVDNETVLAGISMLLWKIPGLKTIWEESICLDYRLKSFTEGNQDRRLEAGTMRQELKYRPCRTPLTGLLSLFSYAAQAHLLWDSTVQSGPWYVSDKQNKQSSITDIPKG